MWNRTQPPIVGWRGWANWRARSRRELVLARRALLLLLGHRICLLLHSPDPLEDLIASSGIPLTFLPSCSQRQAQLLGVRLDPSVECEALRRAISEDLDACPACGWDLIPF